MAVLQVCILAFGRLVEFPGVEGEIRVASGEVARVRWAYLAGGIALQEVVSCSSLCQGRLYYPICAIHQEEAFRVLMVPFQHLHIDSLPNHE